MCYTYTYTSNPKLLLIKITCIHQCHGLRSSVGLLVLTKRIISTLKNINDRYCNDSSDSSDSRGITTIGVIALVLHYNCSGNGYCSVDKSRQSLYFATTVKFYGSTRLFYELGRVLPGVCAEVDAEDALHALRVVHLP